MVNNQQVAQNLKKAQREMYKTAEEGNSMLCLIAAGFVRYYSLELKKAGVISANECLEIANDAVLTLSINDDQASLELINRVASLVEPLLTEKGQREMD